MKSSFKNTLILLFQRIDKVVFDSHQKGKAWKTKKVPHWIVLVLALGLYFLLIWQLWPFLSASEIPLLKYFGLFMVVVFTILFLVLAKIYVSQLLNYKSPYSIQKEKPQFRVVYGGSDTPFHFAQVAHKIDYENASLFKDYLKTSQEDYTKLLSGKKVSEKLIWLPLTDRKLPNFRLFFEFLNHVSEENLEGYYGENLLHLCRYITLNFKSKEGEWTIKQLQKAHSGWKNCHPKRRMDLKIDIDNHLLNMGQR